VEYKRKGQNGLGWVNADFFTENIAALGPAFGGYPSSSTEWDYQENGRISWFIWEPSWGSNIVAQSGGLGLFGQAYISNSNWYNYARLRGTGGASTFFQNDGNPSPQTFTVSSAYANAFDTSQESIVWQGYQTYPTYTCPSANSDITYQFIHVYHP
jgi:hypothetical protein